VQAPRVAQSNGSALALFPTRAVWTLELKNSLTAAPALSGTQAYFPIEADRLAAYDLEEGTLLWIAPARPLSQPAIGDGLVFLVEEGALTALHQKDGMTSWKVPFTETLAVPLSWDNGWLIAATSSGTILAIRAVDGAVLWRQALGAPAHAPPSLAADRVYVPLADGRLIALRLDTGAPTWQRRLGGAGNEILALDDRLYLGSNDNRFYCLRTQDGDVMWRWVTGGDVVGMPVVDEHRVYFVSLDNVLRGLDRNSGAQRWKRPLTLRPTYGLVRVGDALLVGGASSTLSAFNVRDGSPAGQMPVAGELAAAPHVLSAEGLPRVTLVTRDIAKGAIATMLIRAIEPSEVALSPLPNPAPLPKAPEP
jgi:outer membrane protein assembly factor BamB